MYFKEKKQTSEPLKCDTDFGDIKHNLNNCD